MSEPADDAALDALLETPFQRLDRRGAARVTVDELLQGLTAPILVQAGETLDGWRVALVDPEDRRVLAEAPSAQAVSELKPGPCEFWATSKRGVLRMPALVQRIDGTVATLEIDTTRAELDERRDHQRLKLRLAVRGTATSGSHDAWSATTVNICAAGALIDAQLLDGSAHNIVLELASLELHVRAMVWRVADDSQSALHFVGLNYGAERALAGALVRTAATRPELLDAD